MLEINIYGPRHRSAGYWAWFADVDASVRRECVLFRGTRAEILATATALTPGPRVRAGDSHTIRRADPLEEFLLQTAASLRHVVNVAKFGTERQPFRLQTAASLRHVVNQTCDGYVCELCGEELRHVDAVMDDALEDVDGDIVGYSIPWYDQDDAHEAPSENAVMCLECWRANMSE